MNFCAWYDGVKIGWHKIGFLIVNKYKIINWKKCMGLFKIIWQHKPHLTTQMNVILEKKEIMSWAHVYNDSTWAVLKL